MDGVQLLSLLTLASNIFLGYLVLAYLLKMVLKANFWDLTFKYIKKYALPSAFLVALTSMTGSLYLSEIKGFTPCIMCWYQRILMYPQTFILGSALINKRRDSYLYVLPMTVLGIFFSAYHYYLQMNPEQLAPCTTVGFSVSCSERFTTNYGYITIPWMALSAFVLITFFILVTRGKVRK
jgi:disulfide bond formation protein DsbB